MMKAVPTRHETLQFAVEATNGALARVGKTFISSPKVNFGGGSICWFDDSKLIRK